METIDVILKVPAPGTDVVYLFNEINTESTLTFVKDINNLNDHLDYFEKANVDKIKKWYSNFSDNTKHSITVKLNTEGGYCYDGFSICNTISEISNERPVYVHATGLVASMGISVLLSVPLERRYASKNTTFMIHQVIGFAMGKTADVENELDEMKRIQAMIWKIIAEKTKITEEQLQDCYDCKRDWFISAEEALELGIISKII